MASVWSSLWRLLIHVRKHRSSALGSPEGSRHSSVADIMTDDSMCNFDAVVVLNQPDVSIPNRLTSCVSLTITQLRAQDLKSLSSSSAVPSRLRTAPHSLQNAYMQQHSHESVADAAQLLATRCGSSMRWLSESGDFDFDSAYKHVVHVSLPQATGSGSWRKSALKDLGAF